jgi:hypothetical protein
MYFYYVLFEYVIFKDFFCIFSSLFFYFVIFLFKDFHFVMIFPHQYLFH